MFLIREMQGTKERWKDRMETVTDKYIKNWVRNEGDVEFLYHLLQNVSKFVSLCIIMPVFAATNFTCPALMPLTRSWLPISGAA